MKERTSVMIEARRNLAKTMMAEGKSEAEIYKTLAPTTSYLITGYSTSDNSVEIDSAWYSVSEIVDLFTFLDKMPCGISLGNPNRAPVQKKPAINRNRQLHRQIILPAGQNRKCHRSL